MSECEFLFVFGLFLYFIFLIPSFSNLMFLPQAMHKLTNNYEFSTMNKQISEKIQTMTSLSTKYMKTKDGTEHHFFSVIGEEPLLAPLRNYDDEYHRYFYRYIGGKRHPDKLKALDRALTYYTYKTCRRQDGNLKQPNTFMTSMRALFARFKERGIEYSASVDFKGKGTWASWLNTMWNDQHSTDPTFGDRPTKVGKFPADYVQIVRQKILQDKVLDVRGEDVEDLHLVFAFICGTQFLFRGYTEHKNVKFSAFRTGTYDSDHPQFPRWKYLEICDTDKTNKISVSNHTVFNAERNRRIPANPDDPISGYAIYEKLKKIKHPDQDLIYCHPLTRAKRNKQYWIKDCKNVFMNPDRPYGQTKINKVSTRSYACVCFYFANIFFYFCS